MTTTNSPYLAEERNDDDPVLRASDNVVKAQDLLSAISTEVSARSGGPPYLGATHQADGLGSFVWSRVDGYYRSFEDGSQMITEDGILRITES